MLVLFQDAAETIRRHAREGFPLEICGFLAGDVEGDTRTARQAWPVRNAWEEDAGLRQGMLAAVDAQPGATTAGEWEAAGAGRRFLVSPRDILQCEKRARSEGLKLIGVYHTHPNHPAVPSDFDRDAAWPEWSYLILSVHAGEVAAERSWVLIEKGDEREFVEESVAVTEPGAGPEGG
jgi:proteasome lid subunit RPN8/RPN11